MEHIKEFKEFLLTEGKDDKKKIKKYSEVKVGDMAMENPDAGGVWDSEHGEIVWKGTVDELKFTLSDWEDEVDDDPAEYDLVVVRVPNYGDTLFNYNNDPSGAVVYKK